MFKKTFNVQVWGCLFKGGAFVCQNRVYVHKLFNGRRCLFTGGVQSNRFHYIYACKVIMYIISHSKLFWKSTQFLLWQKRSAIVTIHNSVQFASVLIQAIWLRSYWTFSSSYHPRTDLIFLCQSHTTRSVLRDVSSCGIIFQVEPSPHSYTYLQHPSRHPSMTFDCSNFWTSFFTMASAAMARKLVHSASARQQRFGAQSKHTTWVIRNEAGTPCINHPIFVVVRFAFWILLHSSTFLSHLLFAIRLPHPWALCWREILKVQSFACHHRCWPSHDKPCAILTGHN